MSLELVTKNADVLEGMNKERIQYVSIPFKDNVYMFIRPKASMKVIEQAFEVARQTGSHFIVKKYGKAPAVCVDGAWETFAG